MQKNNCTAFRGAYGQSVNEGIRIMKIDLNLSQKQQLSPYYIQMIEILQKGTLEIDAYIENLALENPLISLEPAQNEVDYERAYMLQQKLQWLEENDYENKQLNKDDLDGVWGTEAWQKPAEEQETLYAHLQAQLIGKPYSGQEKRILNYLLQSLDSKGYFREEPSLVAAELHVCTSDVTRLLSDVQALDPPGVGARDLSECLLLQLQRLPGHSPVSEEIALHHLESFAKNHVNAIAKKLNVSREDVIYSFNELKQLKPIPGNSFSDGAYTAYVRPDVIVSREGSALNVLVSGSGYSKITLQEDYLALADSCTDAPTKKYLREKKRQVMDVISALEYRNTSLAMISQLIVQHQLDFFLTGSRQLRPLTLDMLAAQTNLHISTVSRALSNKYLMCAWGVFPLRFFLSRKVNDDTADSMSNKQVEMAIRKLIENENKNNPLSDEKLSVLLRAEGIHIARRTVAKYRSLINIPDCNGRREKE